MNFLFTVTELKVNKGLIYTAVLKKLCSPCPIPIVKASSGQIGN